MTFIGFPALKRKHKCGKKEQYNASAIVCQDAAFSAFDKVHGSKFLLYDFEQVLTWLSVSSCNIQIIPCFFVLSVLSLGPGNHYRYKFVGDLKEGGKRKVGRGEESL